jgi:hypothetical protein
MHTELTAHQKLQATLARRDAATRALAAADADVARKHAIETDYQGRLETAEADIHSNDDIEAARDLAEERRNVEAQLTAARNLLRKSRDAQTIARNESQAAAEEVEKAADAILEAETQALLEEFESQYQALLREAKRVASYLPDALNTRINDTRTARVRGMIDGLVAARDLMYVPISELRWPSVESSAYAERRAALIAGERNTQPAAQCAA